MKCSYFREHLDRLFDSQTPVEQHKEMSLHMQQCPACAELYRQSADALRAVTPNCELRAPTSLRDRIMREAAGDKTAATTTVDCEAKPRRRSLLWRSLAAASAVAAAVILLFDPVGHYRASAASRLFANALAQIDQKPLYMEVEVRSRPADNFAYIDADLPFVTHRMWVETRTSGRWRLEKPQRIAMSNGLRTLMWYPENNTGDIFRSGDKGMIEDFSILLDPSTLLAYEEANAGKEVRYRKEVTNDAIILTVEAPAQGDFTNDDMRNTSISESDSRREYRFDRETGRLEELKIDIMRGDKPTTVARLYKIEYDVPIHDSLFVAPEGIVWKDMTTPIGSTHFANITSEQALRKFIGALQTWDEELLSEVLAYYSLDQFRPYKGSKLIKAEPAYRSGRYPGVFIKCIIAKPDGKQERLRLALRNDNPTQSWVLDGGWF